MSDNEILPPAKQQPQCNPDAQKEIDGDDSTRKSGLYLPLLVAASWLAWLATVVSDTLLAVRAQFWPGELFIKSPIVRYIFTKHIYQWPYGGLYILEPFFKKWSPTITTTFLVSSTICTLLQIEMVRRLKPFSNSISDALVALWLALCILGAFWIGLTKQEVGIIALPFAWLSIKTVQLACMRKGIYPAEVGEGKGRIAFIGSMVLFFMVYIWVIGASFDMIAILLLVEAFRVVWAWMKGQSGDKQDTEKGDGNVVIGE